MKPRPAAPGTLRVAAYTRQSIDEGTQEFKSVHAQRDSIAAYVSSQRAEGWVLLPTHYDDAGFSGGSTNRPAFKRLMSDIEAGHVDVVAVHRTDRLSRSLADFVSIMADFEKKGVTFVSVTQAFSTSTSAGRMMMNMLATFAQYERETISERTKEKIAASRRRGRWTGGPIPLGYDVRDKKLVVNPVEAEQVRAIFKLYLETGSMLATVEALNARGWRTKSWTGKKGQHVASYLYSTESVKQLLTRVVYIGRVKSGKETFPGEHEAIIDQELWDAAQAQRTRKRLSVGSIEKNKHGALLKGVILCGVCGSTMNHSVSNSGTRRRQYYACNRSRRFGREQCPCGPVPIDQIETFVVDKIRAIGADPTLLRTTAAVAREELRSRVTELEAEVRVHELERRRAREERTNFVNAVAGGGPGTNTLMQRVAELDERLISIDSHVREARREIEKASAQVIDEDALGRALREFDGIWNELFAKERARVLALLIERITYASNTGALRITFRTTGLKGLGAA